MLKRSYLIKPFIVAAMLANACAERRAGRADSTTFVATTAPSRFGTTSPEARRHAEAGERLDDQGYGDRAREEFKQAIAADTAFGYADLRVAQSARFTANDNEAREYTRLAAVHGTETTPIERLLIEGHDRIDRGDRTAGFMSIRSAIALAPRDPRLWLDLGQAAFYQNDGRQAGEAFAAALRLDSTFVPAMFWAAWNAVSSQGDLAVAERWAPRGQQEWSNSPIASEVLGDLRVAQGRADEAVAAFSREMTLDPNNLRAPWARGGANTLAGHFDEARRDYDAAMRLAPPELAGEIGIDRALLPAYRGDFDRALIELREHDASIGGLKIGSLSTVARLHAAVFQNQAYIAMMHGRFDVADSAIRGWHHWDVERVKLSSDSVRLLREVHRNAMLRRSVLAAYQSDLAGARRFVDSAVVLGQGDSTFTVPHWVRGAIALLAKQYATARQEFAQIPSLGQVAPQAYWDAVAASALGDTAAARASLKKAILGTELTAAVRYDAQRMLEHLR